MLRRMMDMLSGVEKRSAGVSSDLLDRYDTLKEELMRSKVNIID